MTSGAGEMGEDNVTESAWRLTRDGREYGPLSSRELFLLAKQGNLQPNDLLWKQGFEDWRPASSIPGLLGAPATSSESKVPYGPRQLSVWQIGLGVGVVAGAAAAAVAWILLFQGPSPEQKALLESLTRLHEATSQGVSYSEYTQQLVEVGTKYNLALPHLSAAQSDKIKKAMGDQATAKGIWQITIEPPTSRLCPYRCEDLLPLMRELHLVDTADDYEAYFTSYKWHKHERSSELDGDDLRNFEDGPRNQVVPDALTKADVSLLKAITGLQ